MPKNNNKRRGKYFEDKVAGIIREVFNLDKNVCHRFYESGMAYGEFGDIKTPFPWIIECKYYQDISLDNVVPKENKLVLSWLESLAEEAHKYYNTFKVYPLQTLVFSRPRSEIYVIVRYDNLKSANDFVYTDNFMLDKLNWYALTNYNSKKYIVTSFNDFVIYVKNHQKEIKSETDRMLDAYHYYNR